MIRRHLHRGLRACLICAVFSALSLFAGTAQAQQNPDDPPQFADIVDVRVVNLEAVVTRKGNRVEGLTASDFQLLVDGRETEIEYFSEIRYGSTVEVQDPEDVTALPSLEEGELVGTSFLVFIDNVFTIKPYRNKVLKDLAEQAELMGPKDRMAIVAFDGKETEMLTSWTGSAPELRRILTAAQDRSSRGLLRRSLAQTRVRVGVNRYQSRAAGILDLNSVVDSAAATLRAFAKPPGRKVMLIVSGGWSSEFWDRGQTTDLGGVYSGRGIQRLTGPLVDSANLLGYTLYPIEADGIDQPFADASVATAAEARRQRELNFQRDLNEEGVLLALAEETGGRAFLDGASRNPLSKVQDDTASYYSIGFTPTWRANDFKHSIRLIYKGEGKVRSRESFMDLSRSTELSLQLESARMFDLPLAAVAELRVQPKEPEKAGFRKVVLPIEVEIPLDHVTLFPNAQGWAGRLELRVAVTDDRGDRSDIPVIPIDVFFRKKPGPGETRIYETGLKMRKRPHRLHLSLHDVPTGEALSTAIDVSL